MQTLVAIGKALGDETRVRALYALRDGELCVCQLIELLNLAPSTISKHLDILHRAGLVTRRKRGRWQFYQLAGRGASRPVRDAIRWALRTLEDEQTIRADVQRLCCIREKNPEELTACYRTTSGN